MGRKAQHEPTRLRVYEQWQGNERFFCWGHCVTGPSWKSGMGSLALLIAPTVVFLVFVVPYMSLKLSPVIWIVSCIMPVFCASMLLLTSCRDPGVLPRQEPDEEWLQARKPRTKDVSVNGHRVTVRYNDTCHFYQPPRAHHCSVNDNCIERFDHHCPWVGTTIGKRNYRTFLLFIYSTSVYIAWTFGISLGSLFVKHAELQAAAAAAPPQPSSDSLSTNLWLQTLGQSGAAIALMVFTFIFFWFVCGLSGFHTWLVATNQTTYENFRYNHNQVPNPYSEGLFRNCALVWCVRIPPSKVQFRAFLDEVVREHVELGYPEWAPLPAPTPPRADMHMQMSPMGGSSNAPGPLTQAAAEWSGTSPVQQQYSSTAPDMQQQQQQQYQQQYGASNGNAAQQYAPRAGGGVPYPSVASHSLSPAAAGSQQSFDSQPDHSGELPVRGQAAYHPGTSPSPQQPPMGAVYAAGSTQGPLTAGLAAVQIPQQGDGGGHSAGSSPYYTPQQGMPGAQQGPGPLTSQLQQQQQYQQQPHRRTASIELPAGAGAGAGGAAAGVWRQPPPQSSAVGSFSSSPRGGGGGGVVSHQQVQLDLR